MGCLIHEVRIGDHPLERLHSTMESLSPPAGETFQVLRTSSYSARTMSRIIDLREAHVRLFMPVDGRVDIHPPGNPPGSVVFGGIHKFCRGYEVHKVLCAVNQVGNRQRSTWRRSGSSAVRYPSLRFLISCPFSSRKSPSEAKLLLRHFCCQANRHDVKRTILAQGFHLHDSFTLRERF